jgi:hypothetical protein
MPLRLPAKREYVCRVVVEERAAPQEIHSYDSLELIGLKVALRHGRYWPHVVMPFWLLPLLMQTQGQRKLIALHMRPGATSSDDRHVSHQVPRLNEVFFHKALAGACIDEKALNKVRDNVWGMHPKGSL